MTQFLHRFIEFFKERFALNENVLWRLMGLLKPFKRWIVLANICLFFAQMFSAAGLVMLQPLFDFTLNHRQPFTNAGHGGATPSFSGTIGKKQTSDLDKQLARVRRKSNGIFGNLLKNDPETTASLKHPSLMRRARRTVLARWNVFYGWAQGSLTRFITLYSIFMLGLLTITGLFQFLGDFLMAKISTDVTSELMHDTYANVLRQELHFFDNQSTGALLNICYREIFDLQQMIQFLASTRVIVPIQMVVLFGVLLWLNVKLSLVLLVLLPLIILPTFILTRKIKKGLGREIDEETGSMDVMAQGFHGILAIKAFGAEQLESRQLRPSIEAYVRISRARRAAQAFIGPFVDVLNMAVLLVLFVIALIFLAGRKNFEPGNLIVFMFAITRFYKPMRDIMSMNVRMQRVRAVARRIFAMLDRQPKIKDAPDAVDFPQNWRELIFDDIYLSYKVIRRGQERNRRALRRVNFRIRRGEAVVLIGPNGAGKSSIVNLICRLYEPTQGVINFDQAPLNKIKIHQVHKQICLITQYPILFNRSVADNISFGLENVSREEIIEAAKATGAHGFIQQLPQGYDTYVGEQGRHLSGGERQKIVLARAFVRHPQILILDEPTTGLDQGTTEEFLELMARIHARGVTVIYITHEFSHLSHFQRIFQLTPEKNVIELETLPQSAAAPAGEA